MKALALTRTRDKLLHVDAAGTVVSGMADLIVHTRDGARVIDHMSEGKEDPAQRFIKYDGQLRAYAPALAVSGFERSGTRSSSSGTT